MLQERLQKSREVRGYTKKQVGDYLKMSPEGYGHYESGKRNPSPETINELATLYAVTTDYLLGRTDDPTPPDAKTGKVKPTDSDLKFALFGDTEITDEVLDEVKRFAKFAKEVREKRAND